jgi:hypothetical protein
VHMPHVGACRCPLGIRSTCCFTIDLPIPSKRTRTCVRHRESMQSDRRSMIVQIVQENVNKSVADLCGCSRSRG